MRFAATDANGRAGAVDYTVNAELTSAGPLKMSGLVVAALRDKSMAPAMQFKDEATAVGYVEIYGQLTGQVSARMEVAATADGPAIKTIQPGGQKTSEADKFLLIGEIPIGDLEAGRLRGSRVRRPSGTAGGEGRADVEKSAVACVIGSRIG